MTKSERDQLYGVLVDQNTPFFNVLETLAAAGRGEDLAGIASRLSGTVGQREICEAARKLLDAGQGKTVCRAAWCRILSILHATRHFRQRPAGATNNSGFAMHLLNDRAKTVIQWLLDALDTVTKLPQPKAEILAAATEFWRTGDAASERALEGVADSLTHHDGPWTGTASTATPGDGGRWSPPRSLKEWAVIFDKHPNTLRAWFTRGVVKAKKAGKSWRVSAEELP